MGAALVAGASIGTERSFHGRAAGFRTHSLVCLTSSMLMLVTLSQGSWLPMSAAVRMDPTRMAQGIMTGIGFLGAGVIFKEGLSVRGLTTAAAIWTTAAIGILMGVGFYAAGSLATALTLGILSVFRLIEMNFPALLYAHATVRLDRGTGSSEEEFRSLLAAHGFSVSTLSYHSPDSGALLEYQAAIRTVDPANMSRLASALGALPTVRGFSLSPTGESQHQGRRPRCG